MIAPRLSAPVARNLGVAFDQELSMETHAQEHMSLCNDTLTQD